MYRYACVYIYIYIHIYIYKIHNNIYMVIYKITDIWSYGQSSNAYYLMLMRSHAYMAVW